MATVSERDAVGRPRYVPTVGELRHQAEVPMLVMGGVLLAGAGAVVVYLAYFGLHLPDWASLVVVALALPFLSFFVGIRWLYWSTISGSVEITPRQLPEVYGIYRALAVEMELSEVPRLYVRNGNGALNAFASKCQLTRKYVVIYSDLLDIAYEHGDFTAVKFVLAHELGHIKCGHVAIWRTILQPVADLLFLGKSITRAQEYTADRVASFFAPEGVAGMLVLFAGKRIYRRVDFEVYLDSIQNHKDGFWLRVANLLSDHAVGFRRMSALARTRTEGWDVHGRML